MNFLKIFPWILSIMLLAAAPSAVSAEESEKTFDPYMKLFLFMDVSRLSTGGTTDTDYNNFIAGISRLGVNFNAGNWKSNVELGVSPSTVKLRRIFAEYNFGIGSILFGQEWSPYGYYSEQIAGGLWNFDGYGHTSDLRKIQITLKMFGAYLSLIEPATTKTDNGGTDLAGSTDIVMPKVAVGYDFKSEMFYIGPSFIIQYTNFEGAANPDGLLAWMATLHGGLTLGNFNVRMNAGFGFNPGNLDFLYDSSIRTTSIVLPARAEKIGTDIKNTMVFEGFLDFGYKFPWFTANAGAGYAFADNDNFAQMDHQYAVYGKHSGTGT